MKTWKKILAGTLACLTMLSMTSCSDTTWAFRADDTTITAGMYIGLSMDALNSAYSVEGVDTSKNIFSQKLEDQKAADWIKAETARLCKEYLAIEQKFDEMELAFDEDQQLSLENQIDAYWEYYGSSYEKNGCGKESFGKLITNTFKRSMLFEAIYGEGGEKEVPTSDIETYFTQNYAKVIYFSVSLLDENNVKLEGDALEEKLAEAQELADKADVDNFEQVKADYNASVAGEEPTEIEEDTDTSTIIDLNNTLYSEVFMTALKEAKAGEVKLAEDTNRVYILLKLDVLGDEEQFTEYRSSLLANMKNDEFEETLTSWADAISSEQNDASIRKYNPKNLK